MFIEPIDKINYPQNQYNWTEADMVYLQKGERMARFDYRHDTKAHEGNESFFWAGYNFDINIESYNRLYHYPEYIPKYATK